MASCENDTLQTTEDTAISTFLQTLSTTPNAQDGGLYFIPLKVNDSPLAHQGDSVYVHATMRMLTQKDGTAYRLFYSTYPSSAMKLALGKSDIPGFVQRGLLQMHQGDSAMLVVPSALAYGHKAVGNVPAYTPILVHLKLIEIK